MVECKFVDFVDYLRCGEVEFSPGVGRSLHW